MDFEQVYQCYNSLGYKQKLAFWYYAKEDIFTTWIIESFLNKEHFTPEQLIENMEEEFWDEIPILYNTVNLTIVERGLNIKG